MRVEIDFQVLSSCRKRSVSGNSRLNWTGESSISESPSHAETPTNPFINLPRRTRVPPPRRRRTILQQSPIRRSQDFVQPGHSILRNQSTSLGIEMLQPTPSLLVSAPSPRPRRCRARERGDKSRTWTIWSSLGSLLPVLSGPVPSSTTSLSLVCLLAGCVPAAPPPPPTPLACGKGDGGGE